MATEVRRSQVMLNDEINYFCEHLSTTHYSVATEVKTVWYPRLQEDPSPCRDLDLFTARLLEKKLYMNQMMESDVLLMFWFVWKLERFLC